MEYEYAAQGEPSSGGDSRKLAALNEAIRAALLEDEEDLRAFSERDGEPLIAYEEALAYLMRDGKL